MAFIEPMHRNKPNITYLLTWMNIILFDPNFIEIFTRGLIW